MQLYLRASFVLVRGIYTNRLRERRKFARLVVLVDRRRR